MVEKNLFEIATRNKYTYPYKGNISTEDLWDLNLEVLDSIYKTLNTKAKSNEEDSLLNKTTIEDEVINNKIEIIKYIVSTKQEEIRKANEATKIKEQRDRIQDIIKRKNDEELESKSVEELNEMLKNL